jgi:hypothetical protein
MTKAMEQGPEATRKFAYEQIWETAGSMVQTGYDLGGPPIDMLRAIGESVDEMRVTTPAGVGAEAGGADRRTQDEAHVPRHDPVRAGRR